MNQTFTTSQKWKQFLIILLPILVTQISLSAITFFDTNMSGHFSPQDLAGVAIGTSLWIPIQTGLSGILMGITPIVSQLIGSGRKDDVRFNVIQALYFAITIAILILLVGSFVISPVLEFMNLEDRVRNVAFYFLCAISVGVIPLFGYSVLRNFMDSLGQTRITMIITLISLPINILLNYLLIFGHFGFPRLGGVGAGVASACTYWIIFFISIIVVHRIRPFAAYDVFRKWHGPSSRKWKELLTIGIPIGFAIFFETSVFSAVTLFMSRFDTATIAAHQAALNFASTLYMIPLSISMSLTILVGFEVGARRLQDAKKYSIIGIGSAVTLSLLTAVVLIVFGQQVAGIYSTDPVVIGLIQHFLVYAIFFQISDAVATPVQGSLRGYKDVSPAFIITFIAFWVIGLPVGFITATYTTLGPYGYWIGLIAGLGCGASALLWRLVKIQRRYDQKLTIN